LWLFALAAMATTLAAGARYSTLRTDSDAPNASQLDAAIARFSDAMVSLGNCAAGRPCAPDDLRFGDELLQTLTDGGFGETSEALARWDSAVDGAVESVADDLDGPTAYNLAFGAEPGAALLALVDAGKQHKATEARAHSAALYLRLATLGAIAAGTFMVAALAMHRRRSQRNRASVDDAAVPPASEPGSDNAARGWLPVVVVGIALLGASLGARPIRSDLEPQPSVGRSLEATYSGAVARMISETASCAATGPCDVERAAFLLNYTRDNYRDLLDVFLRLFPSMKPFYGAAFGWDDTVVLAIDDTRQVKDHGSLLQLVNGAQPRSLTDSLVSSLSDDATIAPWDHDMWKAANWFVWVSGLGGLLALFTGLGITIAAGRPET